MEKPKLYDRNRSICSTEQTEVALFVSPTTSVITTIGSTNSIIVVIVTINAIAIAAATIGKPSYSSRGTKLFANLIIERNKFE